MLTCGLHCTDCTSTQVASTSLKLMSTHIARRVVAVVAVVIAFGFWRLAFGSVLAFHGIALSASHSCGPPSQTLLISINDTCSQAFDVILLVTKRLSWLRDSSNSRLLPSTVPTITPA
jgi:hypothetical protein